MPKRWDPVEVRQNKQLVESINGKHINNVVRNRIHYAKTLTDEQLAINFINQLIEDGQIKDPEHTRLNRFEGDVNKEDEFRQKLKKYKQYFLNIKFNTNSNNSDKRYKILMEKLYSNVLKSNDLQQVERWLNGFEDLIEERRA